MVLLAVLVLATYRITRLIVNDTITEFIRVKIPFERWYGELIRCPWCTGVWVAGILTGLTCLFTSVPLPLLVWAAVAGGQGLLASWEG